MTTPFETLLPCDLADLTTEVVAARLESQGRTLSASETAVIALGRRMCVVCAALGLAPDDWAQFSRLTDDDANPRSRDLLGSWVDVVVAARCRVPGDDLVSDLIAIDADGAALTTDELRAIVLELVIKQYGTRLRLACPPRLSPVCGPAPLLFGVNPPRLLSKRLARLRARLALRC